MNNSRIKFNQPGQHKDNDVPLTFQPPIPISSSSSYVTTQSDETEDKSPQEQHDEEEYYYISDQVREYHSLLLQASDALTEDSNACREQCYYLLSSADIRKSSRAITGKK
jgi:hypothetical protein